MGNARAWPKIPLEEWIELEHLFGIEDRPSTPPTRDPHQGPRPKQMNACLLRDPPKHLPAAKFNTSFCGCMPMILDAPKQARAGLSTQDTSAEASCVLRSSLRSADQEALQFTVSDLQDSLNLQCTFDGTTVRTLAALSSPLLPLLLRLGSEVNTTRFRCGGQRHEMGLSLEKPPRFLTSFSEER